MSVTPRSTLLFLSFLNAVSTHPLKSGYYFFSEEENANSIDPEVYMNATELITSKGYPCENHYVTTADGFILNLQRIPHGRQTTNTHGWPKPVVLLQHGLLGSSDCFLQDLANESLAYILADHGMDVWLGNNRGNVYSRQHTILKPSMKEFWAWSWDETAKYDLPASLEHILKTTAADQLYYIGHSQGTEVAFAALSESKEVAARIKLFIAMAPIAYLGNIRGALRLLAPFTQNVQTVLSLLGENEFMPKTEFSKWLATHVCNHRIQASVICQNSNFLIGEYDFKEANKSRLPVYTAHFPAGTSVRNIVHHGQSVMSGKYQMFDFQSPEENMKHYNQTTPPLYDVTKIDTPVALVTGTSDWLANPADVTALRTKLKNIVFDRIIEGWNHYDYLYAMSAPHKLYKDLINLIKIHENSLQV